MVRTLRGILKLAYFDIVHPAVTVAYFATVLVCIMSLFHPILLAAALVMGVVYSVLFRGIRATLATMAWQLPLLLVITLLNPLFVGSGSTEMFRIVGQPFYLESLAYGACMGCMLVSVMLWLSFATQVVSTDKLMSLFGSKMPTVGLVVSMAMRLVPQFLRQDKMIADAQSACTSARGGSGKLSRLRRVTILMGWSMENSLETSDAMVARGWGATTKRTSYSRNRFRAVDAVAVLVILALGIASIAIVVTFGSAFAFYPRMTSFLPLPVCIPYAVLLLLPLAFVLFEKLRWSR